MCHHIYYLLNLFHSLTLAFASDWITPLLDSMTWSVDFLDIVLSVFMECFCIVLYCSVRVYGVLPSMLSAPPFILTETRLSRWRTCPWANRLMGKTLASRPSQRTVVELLQYNEDNVQCPGDTQGETLQICQGSPGRFPRGAHAAAGAGRMIKDMLGRWSYRRHSSRRNN